MPHIFVDRILHIAVTGNLVRIELGTAKVPKSPGESLEVEPSMTLVMPMEGFVQSFGAMDAIVNQMVADGVVTKTTMEQGEGIKH
jgi:hypothetical protein